MVNTWTWGNFYYTQPTNFNASVSMTFPWMQTNVFTLTLISMSQTIDVPALEAALPLLNQGKGCGRLVKERRQLLSFCLERKKKKLKPVSTFCLRSYSKDTKQNGITYLQTSVHEVHLQLPLLLVLRDTSRTRYPTWKRQKVPIKLFSTKMSTVKSVDRLELFPFDNKHLQALTYLSRVLIDINVNNPSVFVALLNNIILDLDGPAGIVFSEKTCLVMFKFCGFRKQKNAC